MVVKNGIKGIDAAGSIDYYRTVQEITRTRDWSWGVSRMISDRALMTDRRKAMWKRIKF